MGRVLYWIDIINERVGRGVSWCTLALIVVVCTDVFCRYLLLRTSPWVMELEWHLFALIFLLGAGYTLKHDAHVRVDVFYENFRARDKAEVNIWGSLFFLLPWSALIVFFGIHFTRHSWLLGEGSENPGGLPFRFLIKSAIPLGFFLLFVQGIGEILRSVLTLREKDQTTPES
jgi:TRAP-type mannitol/chloroaromatic compound transport system permease small subunit